jgi:hypothetical protein
MGKIWTRSKYSQKYGFVVKNAQKIARLVSLEFFYTLGISTFNTQNLRLLFHRSNPFLQKRNCRDYRR